MSQGATAASFIPFEKLVGGRPLAGLRVLDFSRVLSGPTCSMVLADLGADVIKVEDLAGSDTTRHNHPYVNGESHYFLAINRNKSSLTLDLKTPEGRKIASDLAAEVDVVVENFRPGVMKRLGLDYETLSAANPRLIFASLSAFGQDGPLRDKTAYDLVIQALTGAMDVTGEPGRPPAKMGLPLADEISGLFAAMGILASVEKRSRTGRGAFIDTGMFDVGIAMLSYMANIYFATGDEPKRLGSSHPTIYPYNAFKTLDSWIVVAPFTGDFWRKFAKIIGREELAQEDRFKNFAARIKNRSVLAAIIEPIMESRTSAEWTVMLEKGDVPNGVVNSVAEALEMEQTKARGMVTQVDHPIAGTLRTLGTPFKLHFEDRASFNPAFRAAPVLGQHSRAVLRDRLGLSDDQIADLVAKGVVSLSDRTEDAPLPWPERLDDGTGEGAPDDGLPLAGVRVLDLTRMLAGPFAGLLLADMGAEVIKVEEPRIGDPTRRNIPIVNGESTYFMSVNRGKRSLTLDLRSPEGRQALLDLAAEADVVVENYRPGVMARLGLSYDDLRKVNPDIIMCSISGFGATGPQKEKTSFDLVNQAMAGSMAVTGEEGRPPVRIGLPAGDLAGGIYGTFAVLAALRVRRLTGSGAWIDLSLHDILVSLLGYLAQLYFVSGESAKPVGSGHHHIAPYRAFEASDGFLVIAAFNQQFWLKFAKAIGQPEIVDDPRFLTLLERKQYKAELNAEIEPVFKTKTVQEWLDILQAHDVPAARVCSVGEALEAEQTVAREMVFAYDHARAGETRAVGTALRADGKVWRATLPAPILGEHNDDILGGLLGYPAEKIAAMRAAAVIV